MLLMMVLRLPLSAALAATLAAGLPRPGAATPFTAHYEIRAGGLTVMRLETLFDLGEMEYRLTTRLRAVGLAGLLKGGDQVSSVEGRWQGMQPMPLRYRAESNWGGTRRKVAMEFAPGGMPVLRALEPPIEPERETVPPALQRGTIDWLSAVAKLTRTVALTGRCDVEAATFDGRLRADISVRTAGVDRLPPWDSLTGEALRCAFESRLVAGRRMNRDPDEPRQPQPAIAWLARVTPSAPPVPVRVELPSRWFGTLTVVLAGLELGGQQPVQQRR